MPMEWLKRIRLGLPQAKRGKVKTKQVGNAYLIYSAVGQGGTGYKKIENAPISVREKILIRAWRLSGKTAQAFLEEIEAEINQEDHKKLSSQLKDLAPKKQKSK